MKVKTGIFWVIDGEVICDMQVKEIDKYDEHSGYVDYTAQHAWKWDSLCAVRYPDADFATYPRGRVMYSLAEKRYIVYADKCINDEEKTRIVNKYGIGEKQYIFATDIHYRCDKCLNKESVIFAVNTDIGVSVCRVLDEEVIETDFFERNEKQAFTDYCEAYGAYDVHTRRYLVRIYDSTSNHSLLFSENGEDSYVHQFGDGNVYWYMLHRSGYIAGSRENTFETVARYFGIATDYTAENVAKCYYKMKNYAYLTKKEAETVLEDCKYLLANIEGDLHCGSRLGDNIIRLYNCGIGDEPKKISEQSVFNLIVDYLEENDLTANANKNISWAIWKAKREIYESEPFDNPVAYEFKKYLETKYLYRLRAKVLRGENELSGNLIEIKNGFIKILVECGKSLKNETKELDEVEKQVIDERYNAVIVSHNHIDHVGLVERFSMTKHIYMGKLTKKLVKLQYKHVAEKNMVTYDDGEPFYIGSTIHNSITVTPFLCDHSEPDSYMLLFEYDGKKILYTGDFRAHGRKNFDNLLSRLPHKVDTLICEGTNASGEKRIISEVAVQNKLSKLIKETDRPIFILTPTENIDRIVSAYKATVKNNRIFIVDDSEAKKLEIIGGGVPHPTKFSKVYVCYPKGIKKMDFDSFVDYRTQSLGYKDIAERNDYVMLIKASSIGYLTKLAEQRRDGLNGATLIYSLWSGYKENESMKSFLSQINTLGIKIVTLHTSGHADNNAIEMLKTMVNPSYIITVHTPN